MSQLSCPSTRDLESPPPTPTQPQPPQTRDLESPPPPTQPQPSQTTVPPPPTQPQPPQTRDLKSPPTQRNLQWPDLIFGFCLTSAVAIALQSTQTQSQLPLSFHLLSLTLVLSFSALFVANLISSKFPDQAKEVEKVAVFFLMTAFFLAISIPMPLSLKFFTWAMYNILLLTVFAFHASSQV